MDTKNSKMEICCASLQAWSLFHPARFVVPGCLGLNGTSSRGAYPLSSRDLATGPSNRRAFSPLAQAVQPVHSRRKRGILQSGRSGKILHKMQCLQTAIRHMFHGEFMYVLLASRTRVISAVVHCWIESNISHASL